MCKVYQLQYEEAMIGYRFSLSDSESYDIDMAEVMDLNLSFKALDGVIILKDHNSLLLSDDEIFSNIYSIDISDNRFKVLEILTLLQNNRVISDLYSRYTGKGNHSFTGRGEYKDSQSEISGSGYDPLLDVTSPSSPLNDLVFPNDIGNS